MSKKLYPIKSYDGSYSITKSGEIWSHPRKWAKTGHDGKWLKTSKVRGDYLCVTLCKKNIKTKHFISRLVALTFIPNPENKPEVNHKDHNVLNNHASNLEWVTKSENIRYRNKQNKKCTSKYKGVCFDKCTNKWRAGIRDKERKYFLGNFKQEIDAAKAYNKKALEIHGKFALLNRI